jgi:hypothetical protein
MKFFISLLRYSAWRDYDTPDTVSAFSAVLAAVNARQR